MKNKIYGILLCGLVVLGSSCKDFLDFAPESNLTEDKVFSSYDNVVSYFSPVYDYVKNGNPLWIGTSTQGWNLNELTDAATPSLKRPSNSIRNGVFGNQQISFMIDGAGNIDNGNYRPVLFRNFQTIRICNKVLENADRILDAPNQEEIDDLKGQACFIRGYAYFQICRLWGGMPYLRDVIETDDEWDLPRLSPRATYQEIAKDMDEAYEYFKKADRVRRDKNHDLNESFKINLPSGCAALALKSRALLYAASPLYTQDLGDAEKKALWEDAAKAAYDAISVATENEYGLLSIDEWHLNTWGQKYTNEQLWAFNHASSVKFNAGWMRTYLTGIMAKNTTANYGMCPTQNFVDRYETAPGGGDGYSYSLATEEERNKAEQAGVYDPEKPYDGLDKRFYESIYYNGAELENFKSQHGSDFNGKVNMWRDGSIMGDHIDNTYYKSASITGYMQKRITGPMNQYYTKGIAITDPLFMLSELYLNYAEAANEVQGYSYKVEGASLSAYTALMVIRNRAQQGELRTEDYIDKDAFRRKIKNERCVELAFTGHYYFDQNRWMDAPDRVKTPLMMMNVERVKSGEEEGKPKYTYKYTRQELELDHQARIWNDKMYYWPFSSSMYYQYKNFDVEQNPFW